jgi:hypothetical protein
LSASLTLKVGECSLRRHGFFGRTARRFHGGFRRRRKRRPCSAGSGVVICAGLICGAVAAACNAARCNQSRRNSAQCKQTTQLNAKV